ncbi:IST1 [[Candida] subhashii]|uniref:IST1 n=1 Tax=[Candida] subhashii TaxID=561895 RepID=A0A8J5QLU3_9ASCO|nr:IST1 [[Candida] subhashii]KAG7662951.1 IST1 [[Candida] subhashii]
MAHTTPPPQFNPIRLKTALKMAISKLKFIQEKKQALTKQQRRQLADLLQQGKESSALIRVENIIRDDIYIELLEFLELYCELLLARISILLNPLNIKCDENLREAVESIIYSANHTELKELTTIKDLFIYKFGQEFAKNALENKDGKIPERIIKRCSIDPPSETLVQLYLCEIARTYDAPFSGLKDYSISEEEEQPVEGKDEDDDEDGGSGGIKEPRPLEPPIAAEETKPQQPKKSEVKKQQDEFDALKARFAALKGGP